MNALFLLVATILANPFGGLDEGGDAHAASTEISPQLKVLLRFDLDNNGLLEVHEIPANARTFAANTLKPLEVSIPSKEESLNLKDLVARARKIGKRNRSGVLTSQQVEVSVKAKAATMLIVLDKDKDGFLDEKELGKRKSRLMKLDLNRDGKVSSQEYETWFVKVEHDLAGQKTDGDMPQDFHAGIPLLSQFYLHGGSSGVSAYDIFQESSTDINQRITTAINNMDFRDFFTVNQQLEILSAGWRNKKGDYLSAGLYQELDVLAYFPEDLAVLAWEGNRNYIGRSFDLGQLSVTSEVLMVYHVGISRQLCREVSSGM